MAFGERFQKKMEAAGETALLKILGGGFAFEVTLDGERCAVNRMRDRILGNGILQTEVFIYPKNGEKKSQAQGIVMTIHSEVEDDKASSLHYQSAVLAGFRRPMMPEIYYSHVASRSGSQIKEAGYDSFLHHDVMIRTPKKDVIALDEFDFNEHKLFMLGLYGGEYKIEIREKL